MDPTATAGTRPSGDPADATASGRCCGTPTVDTDQDRADAAAATAAPCCGTASQAHAEGRCCGADAKAEALASGAGCCG